MLRRLVFACFSLSFFLASAIAADTDAKKPSAREQAAAKIFNGKNLEGWYSLLTAENMDLDLSKYVTVENGVIHIFKDQKAGTNVPIGTFGPDAEFSHYRLKFEYKWGEKKFEPRMNRVRDNGLLFHIVKVNDVYLQPGKVWPRSIECQVQENDTGDCWLVAGAQATTTVSEKGGKDDNGLGYKTQYVKTGGKSQTIGSAGTTRIRKESTRDLLKEWNQVEVIVRGDKECTYIVNGHEVFHATDLKQLDSDGKTWIPLKQGRIGWQLEYAECFLRNLEISPLDSGPFVVEKAEAKKPEKQSGTTMGAPKIASNSKPEPMHMPNLTVPAGFEIVPAMTEQFMNCPTLACFDEQGRLYVSDGGANNDPFPILMKNPPRSIRRLEDTDGDGVFDKQVIFADKMTFPYGGVFHDGSLYVASDPCVWKLTDTDGDGVADKREEFVGRFGSGGLASAMKGAFLGPDGWLYFNGGNEGPGYEITSPEGKKISDRRNVGGVFRIRPDGRDMEYIACGGSGMYEVCFHPSGDMFGVMTIMKHPRGDGIMHWTYGGAHISVKPPSSLAVLTGQRLPAMIDWPQTSPSGAELYQGDAFKEYQGNLFTAHFNHQIISGKQLVTRNVLERDGATWKSVHEENFVESTDINCKFTDVLEDADGSLLIVNTGGWFRIGCPTSRVDEGSMLGGIYRVRKIGYEPPADPRGLKIDWAQIANQELTKLLDDARPMVRERAIATLAKRGEKAVPALQAALKSASSVKSSSVRLCTNVVWALTRIEGEKARAAVRSALHDTHAEHNFEVPTLAILHSIGLWKDAAAYDDLIRMLRGTDDLAVLRNTCDALARIGNKAAVPALLDAAERATDRFSEHALVFALIQLNDRDATLLATASKKSQAVRAALLALDQMKSGDLSEQQVGKLLNSNDPLIVDTAIELMNRHSKWKLGIAELCKKWLNDKNLSEKNKQTLATMLKAKVSYDQIQQLIAKHLASDESSLADRRMLLDIVANAKFGHTFPKSWSAAVKKCLADKDETLVAETVEALKTLNLREFDADLVALSQDPQRKLTQRIEAALVSLQNDLPPDEKTFHFLVNNCKADANPVTRLAITRGLSEAKFTPQQLDELIGLLAEAGPVEIPSLLRIFEDLPQPYNGETLVNALSHAPGIGMVSHIRIQKLLYKYPASVQTLFSDLMKRLSAGSENQASRLEELRFAETGGDPEHGLVVFYGNGVCGQCHRIDGRGAQIGPDLSEIGKTRTRKEIIEAITFPNATIARGFEPMTLDLRSGKSMSGIIKRVTANDVVIMTADKNEKFVPRDDVEEISPSPTSIMPTGFDKNLGPENMRDIVSFLSTRVGKKKAGQN